MLIVSFGWEEVETHWISISYASETIIMMIISMKMVLIMTSGSKYNHDIEFDWKLSNLVYARARDETILAEAPSGLNARLSKGWAFKLNVLSLDVDSPVSASIQSAGE